MALGLLTRRRAKASLIGHPHDEENPSGSGEVALKPELRLPYLAAGWDWLVYLNCLLPLTTTYLVPT